jgi:alkylation response protein AidB-like acyl-CoA dehydrogenase
VDFELGEEQRAIVEAVERLLAEHAGPARAISLAAEGECDTALLAALEKHGFLEVARGEETGLLEAALVVEAVSAAAGTLPIGADALVLPALAPERAAAPAALADARRPGPVRFAAHARTLLVLDGGEARLGALGPGDAEPVRSNFGYPMGRLGARSLGAGRSLGPGSGERLACLWRVALAAEAAGAMRAALRHTVAYLSERRQFGRPIGSFQAVQHRLAECLVLAEGARWLAFEAAQRGAAPEPAAAAAAHALAAAGRVFEETHQLSGAIGYTREHDLHVWTMRLQALRAELGGVAEHRRALARARWATRA